MSQLPPLTLDNVDEFAAAVMAAEGFEPPFDQGLLLGVTELVRIAVSRAAAHPENLDRLVLESLPRGRAEGLEDILRVINGASSPWPDRFGRSLDVNDILPALVRLVRRGDAEACIPGPAGSELVSAGIGVMPTAPIDRISFRVTPHGEDA